MTHEDLIQGLKEKRVRSAGRVHKLLEKACAAEHQDLNAALCAVREEQDLGQQIEYQLQLLGGA